MSLIKVCRSEDIPEGGMLSVLLTDREPVALYRLDTVLYATSDYCTHGIASLTEGELRGDIIECPFHGGSFNFRTGEPVDAPCTVPLECYLVEERDGDVYVGKKK